MKPGDRVRVKSGSFEGFIGVYYGRCHGKYSDLHAVEFATGESYGFFAHELEVLPQTSPDLT